jgi:hypothetical protein
MLTPKIFTTDYGFFRSTTVWFIALSLPSSWEMEAENAKSHSIEAQQIPPIKIGEP